MSFCMKVFIQNVRFLLCYVMTCSIIRLRWGLSTLLSNKTPSIVGREDTEVGSLLPVSLGTISDECTPTTRIYVINAVTSVNDLVFGTLCLVGVACVSDCQMILLQTVVSHLQSRTLLPFVKRLKKYCNCK